MTDPVWVPGARDPRGGYVPEIRAWLSIRSKTVTPEEMTRRLELEPERTLAIGQRIGDRPTAPVATWHIWSGMPGDGDAWDAETHIVSLLRIWEPRADAIRELLAEPETDGSVVVGVHVIEGDDDVCNTPAMGLAASTMARLAALGLMYDLDVNVLAPDDA